MTTVWHVTEKLAQIDKVICLLETRNLTAEQSKQMSEEAKELLEEYRDRLYGLKVQD